MNVLCVGISHHTAPLEVRERLWFSHDEIRATLPRLKADGAAEAVLFSTCNRTELYLFGSYEPHHIDGVKQMLLDQKRAATVEKSHLFAHSSASATEHLFRVAAGIDSMVIGDQQILSQIKTGHHLAVECGTSGFFMNKLFQTAFHVGKRARRETNISEGAVSFSYAAMELAGRIFDDLRLKTALIIGAGKMAELTAKHVSGRGIGKILITNRTLERAHQLAVRIGGTVVPFEKFRDSLGDVDIVVSSVDADGYVLSAGELKAILRDRGAKAMFIIDLGVPRNIEPAVRELENVFLYDIDNLKSLVDENLQKRRDEIPKVRTIIAEEITAFYRWHSSLEAQPTIVALRDLAEEIRRSEVEKNFYRFEEKDRELLDLVTKRIVNKLLHTPIVNIKNGHEDSLSERLQKINVVRTLFGIDGTRREDQHER